MEHIYNGTTAAGFSSDAKTRVSSYGYQAYQILRIGFIVAPIVAGLDKFFHLLVDWDKYLPPFVNRLTGDVFGSVRCDCGRQLRAAMRLIEQEGHGAVVYQLREGRGIGIINKIRAYALQDEGADTVEANERLGLEVDLRRYDQCVEVFLDLGLSRVRVMSNNPEKIRAFERAGMEVVERVALEVEPHDGFARYLKTKREKMGHLIRPARWGTGVTTRGR
ncbi:MAG: GTP cyclohydrolase II RibA [Pyrinomonadaceae bacterium]